jgi:hypothetical protein
MQEMINPNLNPISCETIIAMPGVDCRSTCEACRGAFSVSFLRIFF